MHDDKLKCMPFSESCMKIIRKQCWRCKEPILEVSTGEIFTKQSKAEIFQTHFSTSIICWNDSLSIIRYLFFSRYLFIWFFSLGIYLCFLSPSPSSISAIKAGTPWTSPASTLFYPTQAGHIRNTLAHVDYLLLKYIFVSWPRKIVPEKINELFKVTKSSFEKST